MGLKAEFGGDGICKNGSAARADILGRCTDNDPSALH
jgi:hypothetical protein